MQSAGVVRVVGGGQKWTGGCLIWYHPLGLITLSTAMPAVEIHVITNILYSCLCRWVWLVRPCRDTTLGYSTDDNHARFFLPSIRAASSRHCKTAIKSQFQTHINYAGSQKLSYRLRFLKPFICSIYGKDKSRVEVIFFTLALPCLERRKFKVSLMNKCLVYIKTKIEI